MCRAISCLLLLTVTLPKYSLGSGFPTCVRLIDDRTRIYSQPDPFSSTLHLGKANETYPLIRQSGVWHEVLLPDGQTGWIPKQHLILRPAGKNSVWPNPEIKQEFLGALAGTAAAGAVDFVLLWVLFYQVPLFEGLFEPVHGSNVISKTTAALTEFCLLGSIILTPAAAAFGVNTVGERNSSNGSFWASWAGATLGLAAGWGVDNLLNLYLGGSYNIPLFTMLGTPLGAVIGYEMSKPKPLPVLRSHSLRLTWAPPCLAFDRSKGQAAGRLRLNLIGLGF